MRPDKDAPSAAAQRRAPITEGQSKMSAEPYQDTRRSVLVAVACSWCLFWNVIVNRSGGIVFVTMISEMGATREAASWPFSLLGAVANIFGILSGILLRKLPLRAVSLLGSTFVAVGILLSVVFYGVIGITLCIGIITSIGQGMIFPANMVAINTYFKKYRATGSGISYVGGTLVSFIFPPLLVYMNDQYGLRGTLLIVGGLSLNALAGSLLIAEPRNSRKKRAADGAANEVEPLKQVAKVEEAPNRKDVLREELSFMRRPIYYVVVLSGVVFAYSLVMFVVTVVDHGMGRGLSKLAAATLLSCYGGGELVGRFCSGILSDKKLCHRRDIMAMGFFLMSLSFVALIYADSMPFLGAASVLFGLTNGSVMILFSVLLVEYFGLKKLPMAIGIHFLVNGLSALPRPLVIGKCSTRCRMSFHCIDFFVRKSSKKVLPAGPTPHCSRPIENCRRMSLLLFTPMMKNIREEASLSASVKRLIVKSRAQQSTRNIAEGGQ